MKLYDKIYAKVAGWACGWKTKATAAMIGVVNFWDAVAPQFDLGTIFDDAKHRAAFTAAMAVMAYWFRGMADKEPEAK